MASPTFLTFASTQAPTVPTFVGNGSKIEVPDLQVVFWGPYWPGTGQLTVAGLMQAVTSIVTGPYLEGMRQYGYAGPVKLRQPIVNTGNPNINYPAPGANVDQSTTTLNSVLKFVDGLQKNGAMGDVTSNHDLLVLVFLDPNIPFPQTFDANGNPKSTIFGEHAKYELPRVLAPAVRFAFGWVGTRPGSGMSAFDQSTWTFSHELVEAISNPFNGSGWVQTSPASASGTGEIGDVCNNTKCVVDSIAVQPYWGVQQGECILPTEARQLHLMQAVTKHVPLDGPTQHATVNMGVLCGTGTFDFVERTWDNVITITALHPGYQVPQYTWTINGKVVPAGNSTVLIPATWEPPRASIDFTILVDLQDRVRVPIGAVGHPNGVPAVIRNTAVSGTLADTLRHSAVEHVGSAAERAVQDAAKAAAAAQRAGGVIPPFEHKPQATVRVTVFDSLLLVECGPGEGNCSFTVGCQAVENWDGLTGTTVTTQNSSQIPVFMENQEIVWGDAFHKAAEDCFKRTHKTAGGGGQPGVPINPGDPAERLREVEQINQVNQASPLQNLRKIPQLNKHE
jgi:hypothetical protein